MEIKRIYLKDEYPFLGENGKNAYVDIFLPYNMGEMNWQNKKRPCVVICPGGGYRYCSEREGEPFALKLISEGFNAFVINYSVTPHAFPSQLLEVAAVMELIYKNSEAYNCDTDKIVIMGFSAGGHLAAHYSNMYDCNQVRERFPQSKGVCATVLGYPVITADARFSHAPSFQRLSGKEALTQEERDYLSCDKNVTENTPPAFIWHTAQDKTVPFKNSMLYAEALAEKGVPFELHIYPFGNHGIATVDETTCSSLAPEVAYNNWLPDLKKWLKMMNITY